MRSTADNEEIDFIKKQEKCLVKLKKIAEERLGAKITENCYIPSHEDTSKGDFTNKGSTMMIIPDNKSFHDIVS
jgi:hypothetical protein